jgi:tape measure domain-containing protein
VADRVISIRLKMEIDQARRANQQFAGVLRGVGQAAEGAGNASSRAMGAITASAVGAGKAVAAVGAVSAGGMGVLTASVIKGGVAYNVLEQTSRAALTTVLGSASAATSQMEQLREFGKQSPFPRQVWIQAQQTLLAFGMSAEKIIPTFQAIEDAVAASGGNAQTISEVTQILARIQSTGKVTAEELNELGYRGIDAAKLVGEAMGKTAGEVRADITSQAISGQQFLDTLTVAMSQHFEGAAAGVKATWTGAVDRVKGAVRDIGGLLASPLVDPEGGGAAVDWANAFADALRELEARLEPVMDALGDRAGPVFDAITAKLKALSEWIRTANFSEIGQKIQSMLPGIAGLTAGISVMGAKSLPIIGDMVAGLRPLPIAIAAAALASPELRNALMELLAAAQPLLSAGVQLAGTLATALGPALSALATLLQPVIWAVQLVGNVLEALPGPIQMVIAGFVAWKALGVGSWLVQSIAPLRTFNDQMKVHSALAAAGGQKVGQWGSALSVAQTRVSNAGAAVSRMRSAMGNAVSFMGGPWGMAIGAATIGLGFLAGANANAAQEEANHQTQVSSLAEALRNSNGAIDEHVAALALQRIEETGAAAAARELGIPVTTLTQAYLGNKDAISEVQAALQVYLDQVKGQGQLEGQVAGQNPMADKAHELKRILEGLNPEMGEAQAKNRDYKAVTEGAAGASDSLATSLYGVGDAADSVATRTQQLNGLLSGLFDSQFALQKASDDFQGGLLSLKGAFDSNDKAASKSANTADKYNDSLKRQQKIARDTAKQLEDLAEQQREAEKEAAEAAKAARQRALDELFGKQFDVQATLDAFRSGLAQVGKDIADARGSGIVGATSLTGFSEGALSNRERMRSLVQQAQAAIQAERDRGASQDRINQVSRGLAAQLAQQAAAWGLNASEVKAYTDAIGQFGNLASQKISVDLNKVRQDFAEQRKEIAENSAEQMENARQSASTAAASMDSAGATKQHTAALQGNSESAIRNREMMRQLVKQAQDELTQMHLNGATKEELTTKGEELATQLMQESIQLGFTEADVRQYTDTIKVSAEEIARYPTLNARANVAGAMTTVQNFVSGVNKQLAKIQKNFEINVRTGSEFVNSMAGGRHFAADGGLITGPGGPREDKIPAMLSNGEFVINARDTARNRGLLEVINQGGEITRAGFARGGYVDPINLNFKGRPSTGLQQLYDGIMGALVGPGASPIGPASGAALQWAASQAGKPYIWGGVGPRGYDCSGFMSAITNVIQGRNPHQRRFATGSFPVGDFVAGPGRFMIGSRRGNPGHMAGTLSGVNVESRGGEGVVVGKRARGAFDGLFGGNVWHLKGYKDGGMVSGDPPFDLLSPLGMHFEEILGSYAKGTDYVPMDGLYALHRGEAVTPAAQNVGGTLALEGRLESDGTKFGDLVTDSLNKGINTGRIRLVKK